MTRGRRGWVILLVVMFLLMGLSLLFVKPASATEPTPKMVQSAQKAGRIVARKQLFTYSRDVKVWYPRPEIIIPGSFNLRVTYNTIYWYWPGTTATNNWTRVGPIEKEVCYAFTDDHRPSLLFDGVKALPTYFDSYHMSHPGPVKAGRDGRQNCHELAIPAKRLRWFRIEKGAAVSATGWVVWKDYPDQEFQWRKKLFTPKDDYPITGWESIEKPF